MLQNRRGGNTLVVFFILLQWSIIPTHPRGVHRFLWQAVAWATVGHMLHVSRRVQRVESAETFAGNVGSIHHSVYAIALCPFCVLIFVHHICVGQSCFSMTTLEPRLGERFPSHVLVWVAEIIPVQSTFVYKVQHAMANQLPFYCWHPYQQTCRYHDALQQRH